MKRGTTPTLIFNFCDCIELKEAEKIVVSFSQKGELLFNRDIDLLKEVQDNKIILTLTQEETFSMKENDYVRYQVRILINGTAFSTPIYKSMVLESLDETSIGNANVGLDEVLNE